MNLTFDNYLFFTMLACAIIMMIIYYCFGKKYGVDWTSKGKSQKFEILLLMAVSFVVGIYLLYVALFSTEITYKLPLGVGLFGYEFRLGICLGGVFVTKHSLSTIISLFLELKNNKHLGSPTNHNQN